jgi:hypothetical protein
MHHIRLQKDTTKDTLSHSYGNYEQIAVLHENDLKDGVIKLRGYTVDLILIPKTFDLQANKDIERLLQISLRPKGRIKVY